MRKLLFAILLLPSLGFGQTICQLDDSDSDGDGWGWENDASCRVAPGTNISVPDETPDPGPDPACQSMANAVVIRIETESITSVVSIVSQAIAALYQCAGR